MSKDTEIVSADTRAARAAEVLARKGASVTGAAVRERSGVRMATAHAAAKAWREREKAQEDATEAVPEQLLARFSIALEAAWREARTLSRAEFDDARAGWEAKLVEAGRESAKLTVAVDELEQEIERIDTEAKAAATRANEDLAAERDRASAQAADSAAQIATERSRADRAEGAFEVVAAERYRLLAELESTRSK